MSFGTHIDIEAPVEDVWQALMNVEDYPQWNPFTPKTQTTFEIDSPITLHVRLFRCLPKFIFSITETINEREDYKILGWRAHQIAWKTFNSKRNYILEDLGNGRTRLSNTMRYEGWLYWFIGPLTKSLVLDGFEDCSLAIKEWIEKKKTA